MAHSMSSGWQAGLPRDMWNGMFPVRVISHPPAGYSRLVAVAAALKEIQSKD